MQEPADNDNVVHYDFTTGVDDDAPGFDHDGTVYNLDDLRVDDNLSSGLDDFVDAFVEYLAARSNYVAARRKYLHAFGQLNKHRPGTTAVHRG